MYQLVSTEMFITFLTLNIQANLAVMHISGYL